MWKEKYKHLSYCFFCNIRLTEKDLQETMKPERKYWACGLCTVELELEDLVNELIQSEKNKRLEKETSRS